MILYFTYEYCGTLKSFSFVSWCQNYQKTESGTGRNIRNKNNKNSRRGSRSPNNAEFGHFCRCCLAEDGKEMYQEL